LNARTPAAASSIPIGGGAGNVLEAPTGTPSISDRKKAPKPQGPVPNLGYYTGSAMRSAAGGARNPQWVQFANANDPRIFRGPLAG
jgi:hypothetical protein